MKKLIVLVALFGIIMSGGCASIVSKSQYPVTIKCNPADATCIVKNKKGEEIHKAMTPTTITLPAGDGYFSSASYSIEFQKEGYYKSTSTLGSSMDGWYIGNILFGGLIGFLIVDPLTGAMWKLDDAVVGNLTVDPAYLDKKIPNQMMPASNELTSSGVREKDIATQLKELKDLKDSGILNNDEYEVRRKALVSKLPN